MRAAVFQGTEIGLTIETVPDPTPGDRQVVVEVGACGICGTDLTITSDHGIMRVPPGYTPGHEFGGEVVAVGPGVESITVGDHVAAMAVRLACGRCESCRRGEQPWCTGTDKVMSPNSGYAEYAIIGEPQAVHVPRSMSSADAALIEPLAVGLHAIVRGGLKPGDDVVVFGAGPIALGTVYWARRHGASRIVVVATSRRREDFAMNVGASTFVVSGDDLVEEAVEAAGGAPPVVIDAAGVPGVMEQAIGIVGARGTVVLAGCCTVPDTFVPARGLLKEVDIRYADLYNVGEYLHTIQTLEADPVGPRSMITRTIGFDALPAMFESLRGPTAECKVQIDPRA